MTIKMHKVLPIVFIILFSSQLKAALVWEWEFVDNIKNITPYTESFTVDILIRNSIDSDSTLHLSSPAVWDGSFPDEVVYGYPFIVTIQSYFPQELAPGEESQFTFLEFLAGAILPLPLPLPLPLALTDSPFIVDPPVYGGTEQERIHGLLSTKKAINPLEINIVPVPVPSAVWFFGSGLIGLIGLAKCKKV